MSNVAGKVPRTQTNGTRNWSQFFAGLAFVVIGLVVVLWPGLTMATLASIAGIVLICAGAFDLFTYVRLKRAGTSTGWALAHGLCNLALGLFFICFPLATALMITWIFGVCVMIYGIFAVVSAARLRAITPGWVLMLVNGLVSVACGIIFICAPTLFVVVLGIFLIMRGITMAAFGIIAPHKLPYE